VAAVGLREQRGPALLALLVATFLIGMSAWVISTAVPSIVADIGGFASFPWLFSAYLLTMTVTVPVFSKLADTIGRKRLLLFGLAVFILGSVLCGLAWSMPSLIVFRVVQALGGGSIQPLALTVIGDLYERTERARVQGYLAVTLATASVIGPAVGGIFAMFDLWRLVFLINLPLGLVAAWLIHRNLREKISRRAHRIDVPGAVLVTGGLTLLILGLLEGGDAWEWMSPTSVGVFGGGIVLMCLFLVRETRAAEPVIPLGLFRQRLVVMLAILGVMMGGIMVGLTAFAPTYLQVAAGVSPVWAGVAVATMAIGTPASSALAATLYLRWGVRRTTVLGAAIALAGAVGLAALAPFPSVWTVAVCAALVGVGFGFTTIPGLVAVQESVPWEQRGVVTGLVTFFRTLGQAVGVAVLGAVAKSILEGGGAGRQDPAAVLQATIAVFAVVAVFAVIHLLGACGMSRDRTPAVEALSRAAA